MMKKASTTKTVKTAKPKRYILIVVDTEGYQNTNAGEITNDKEKLIMEIVEINEDIESEETIRTELEENGYYSSGGWVWVIHEY